MNARLLFDHLVGGHEQAGRHDEAESLRRLEVDDGLSPASTAIAHELSPHHQQ
jgi:hypothetical protein